MKQNGCMHLALDVGKLMGSMDSGSHHIPLAYCIGVGAEKRGSIVQQDAA